MSQTPGRATTAGGAQPPLDADQQAILALPTDASAMVIGAPGTGKTTLLVARAAELARRGVPVDDILVLTADRQTATALRDRLGVAVDRATSGPLAHSVASFAFRVVRAAAARAGDPPPRLLTGGDEDALVRDLLAGDVDDERSGRHRWPGWLSPDIRDTRGFRSETRAFLAECLTWGVGPTRLAAAARQRQIAVWESMASFFEDYLRVRAHLRSAHRDAAGLVREAAGLLRSADAGARDAFAHTRVVLVDDAQELTRGGVDLVDACRRRGAAVMAFGDPDVSAGAFRGALPETFARLAADLADTRLLTVAHRGTPALVDVVRRVTSRIGAAGGVTHRRPESGAAVDGAVRVFTLGSAAQEADAIARLLRERHVHDRVDWADCAVIAHDTRQVAGLARELAVRDVPARVRGTGPALGTIPVVRDMLHVVDLAARGPQTWTVDDVATALCGAVGGLDAVGLRRVRRALGREELRTGGDRRPDDVLLDSLRHPAEAAEHGTREIRQTARMADLLHRLQTAVRDGGTAQELLWSVWTGSGLRERCERTAVPPGTASRQRDRDLDAVVALFQAAKRFDEAGGSGAVDPLSFVRDLRDSDVAQDRLESRADDQTVAVLTPAAALGSEFDTVVIAGVQDGVWPNTRLRGSLLQTWRLADLAGGEHGPAPTVELDRRRSALHDELRLFARAVSRARSRLIVTAVDDDDTGASILFELLPDAEPAGTLTAHPLSLRGMVAAYRRTLTQPGSSATARDRAAGQLAILAAHDVPGAAPGEWYGVAEPTSVAPLRDLAVEDVRVSPSRLAALERCQLDWVIAELGGDPGTTAAGLGTIIHAALENAASADEDALWRAVDGRWGELEFDAAWLERVERTRAKDLVHRLHLYLTRFAEDGGRLVQAEPHFEVPVVLDPGEHDAVVSGYIDRVEVTAGGSVVIVDLKTGGNEPTADAAVADNPQLAAYQLAFESGAVAGTAGRPGGGAKLLVLQPGGAKRPYAEPWQPPFDDETREAFLHRVRTAAHAMAGTSFTAPFQTHCRDEHAHGLCRIHTVPPVSAP